MQGFWQQQIARHCKHVRVSEVHPKWKNAACCLAEDTWKAAGCRCSMAADENDLDIVKRSDCMFLLMVVSRSRLWLDG